MSEGSRRVMNAIAAAAADHSRVLDLRHLRLDAVPTSVGELTQKEIGIERWLASCSAQIADVRCRSRSL